MDEEPDIEPDIDLVPAQHYVCLLEGGVACALGRREIERTSMRPLLATPWKRQGTTWVPCGLLLNFSASGRSRTTDSDWRLHMEAVLGNFQAVSTRDEEALARNGHPYSSSWQS